MLDLENENMMRVAELEKQLLQREKELEVVKVRWGAVGAVGCEEGSRPLWADARCPQETYEHTSHQVHTLRRMIKEKDEAFRRHYGSEPPSLPSAEPAPPPQAEPVEEPPRLPVLPPVEAAPPPPPPPPPLPPPAPPLPGEHPKTGARQTWGIPDWEVPGAGWCPELGSHTLTFHREVSPSPAAARGFTLHRPDRRALRYVGMRGDQGTGTGDREGVGTVRTGTGRTWGLGQCRDSGDRDRKDVGTMGTGKT